MNMKYRTDPCRRERSSITVSRRRPGMMRIGELAARTGLTAPTIRYYEQIGLLPGGPRPRRSHRMYTEDDVDRLDLLRRLRDLLGVSLDQLKEIAAAEETAAALPDPASDASFGCRAATADRRERCNRPTRYCISFARGRSTSGNSETSSPSAARGSDGPHHPRLIAVARPSRLVGAKVVPCP